MKENGKEEKGEEEKSEIEIDFHDHHLDYIGRIVYVMEFDLGQFTSLSFISHVTFAAGRDRGLVQLPMISSPSL